MFCVKMCFGGFIMYPICLRYFGCGCDVCCFIGYQVCVKCIIGGVWLVVLGTRSV